MAKVDALCADSIIAPYLSARFIDLGHMFTSLTSVSNEA